MIICKKPYSIYSSRSRCYNKITDDICIFLGIYFVCVYEDLISWISFNHTYFILLSNNTYIILGCICSLSILLYVNVTYESNSTSSKRSILFSVHYPFWSKLKYILLLLNLVEDKIIYSSDFIGYCYLKSHNKLIN